MTNDKSAKVCITAMKIDKTIAYKNWHTTMNIDKKAMGKMG